MLRRRSETVTHDTHPTARGGVLFGPIITGVLVAFGAMFLLSALIAGVIAALGYDDEIAAGQSFEIGAGAAVALVVAQLLAYMWGGYTAGRMSRGAGLANGLLVPLAAIVVAVIVGAIAAMLGATTNLNIPFDEVTLPVEGDLLIDWGPTVGIATVLGMFLGGALGGLMGARWHSKLERRVVEEERAERTDEARTTPAAGDEHRADEATTNAAYAPPPPAGSTTGETSTITTEDGRPVPAGNTAETPSTTSTTSTSERSVSPGDTPGHEPRR